MRLTCIRAFGDHVPGDVVDVPEGAFDPVHWQDATSAPAAAAPQTAPPSPAAAGTTPPLAAAQQAAAATAARLNGDGNAS